MLTDMSRFSNFLPHDGSHWPLQPLGVAIPVMCPLILQELHKEPLQLNQLDVRILPTRLSTPTLPPE
jgi:hypothetical protein